MSDSEFWRSTPAKLFALLDYHNKIESPNEKGIKPPSATRKMTLDDFRGWGGRIK